jgi:two-component system, OmpR family, sensor histidine kinase QseC
VKRWSGPSLVRRVVLALLLAFLLVWAALVVREFITFKQPQQHREALAQAAQMLASSLDFDDAQRARIVVTAAENLFNRSRRAGPFPHAGDMLLLLEKADGTPVYASAPSSGRRIPRTGTAPDQVTVGGRLYWSAIHETPAWRLQVLEPALGDRDVLQFMGENLLPSLFIAFPLVLLPLWLAVRRGLAPLRAFATRMQARAPDDFSPMEAQLKYAELQPLGMAFDGLLSRARQGIARERAFVQDAAHELRTPLAVVAAQAHVLANAGDAQQRVHARDALEHAVARASHLVRQLLTLAALEGGAARQARPVELVGISRDVLIASAPAAAARRIVIALDSADRVDAVLDAATFHSVLENLLANAIAYSHEGSEVVVSLDRDGERVRLRVSDNGPGIAEPDMPHLFERFYRGRGVTASGSGLGLAIVRQAVDNLGGEIGIGKGLNGLGVAFDVCWPRAGRVGEGPAATA